MQLELAIDTDEARQLALEKHASLGFSPPTQIDVVSYAWATLLVRLVTWDGFAFAYGVERVNGAPTAKHIHGPIIAAKGRA